MRTTLRIFAVILIIVLIGVVAYFFSNIKNTETFKITYNLNGGTINGSSTTLVEKVRKDSYATDPGMPVVDNGGFSYWEFDNGEVFTFTIKIDRDYNLKAIYDYEEDDDEEKEDQGPIDIIGKEVIVEVINQKFENDSSIEYTMELNPKKRNKYVSKVAYS